MKVLITGGFGYLGGRLAQRLAAHTDAEICVGTRRYSASAPWLPRATVVRTVWDSPSGLEDICTGVHTIVHLAGMNAQDCAADPVAALECNGVATSRLLQAAVQQGARRFVYLSTAQVYASPLTGAITEETCPAGLHPYATSHRAGEDVVRAAHARGEIEGVVIRLSNAFGAPAHKDTDCWTLVCNDLSRQAATTGHMVLRSTGLQRRDFITMTDACRAIHHLMDAPASRLDNGVFNVGGAWRPTILEISEAIRQAATEKFREAIQLSSASAGDAAPEPMLTYRIDKLAATGFHLESNRNAEIARLLDFCRGTFGGSASARLNDRL